MEAFSDKIIMGIVACLLIITLGLQIQIRNLSTKIDLLLKKEDNKKG
jgi:hypothetical protein